jgi:hypothetical protein
MACGAIVGAQENENIERLKSGEGQRQSPVERLVNGHFQRSRQSRSPATFVSLSIAWLRPPRFGDSSTDAVERSLAARCN